MNYEEMNKGCFEEARRLYKTANTDQRYVLEKLFPELAESEDERIRKNCIHFLELQKSHHAATFEIDECIAWLENQREQEKDILEDAILDGYILDGNEDSLIAETIRYKHEKQGGQKPAWGEAGEINKEILNAAILFAMNSADEFACNGVSKEDVIDWLKSLRPQNHWKPSDRQIDSITCAVKKMKESACYDSELVSLLNDLKKLKEE